MSKTKSRRFAKHKRDGSGFVALGHVVIQSPQWAALSPHGVKLLCDLLAQYKGENNGDLNATWNTMHLRGWRSRDTLHKALQELLVGGWIAQTAQGGLHRPSLYGVTFYALDAVPKLDVTAAGFPRGAWSRGPSAVSSKASKPPKKSASANTPRVSRKGSGNAVNGASSNTPRVSIASGTTRPACQLPDPTPPIDTPGVRVKAISDDPLTRPACTSIEVPSPPAEASGPERRGVRPVGASVAADPAPPPPPAPAVDPEEARLAESRRLIREILAGPPRKVIVCNGPERAASLARRATADARKARRVAAFAAKEEARLNAQTASADKVDT